MSLSQRQLMEERKKTETASFHKESKSLHSNPETTDQHLYQHSTN